MQEIISLIPSEISHSGWDSRSRENQGGAGRQRSKIQQRTKRKQLQESCLLTGETLQ